MNYVQQNAEMMSQFGISSELQKKTFSIFLVFARTCFTFAPFGNFYPIIKYDNSTSFWWIPNQMYNVFPTFRKLCNSLVPKNLETSLHIFWHLRKLVNNPTGKVMKEGLVGAESKGTYREQPELTSKMENGITGLDVRQEGIPQALTFWCSFHKTSNVSHIQESWDFTEKKKMVLEMCDTKSR